MAQLDVSKTGSQDAACCLQNASKHLNSSCSRGQLMVHVQGFQGAQHVAQGDVSMTGSQNAAYCLQQGTCQPLGSHSVWAAFPPLPEQPQAPKPIVLVTAGMDGAGLFHDAIQASCP